MPAPRNVVLYVKDTARSEAFYSRLLGSAPVQSGPGYVYFAPEGGMPVGLWRRTDAQPSPQASPGACELNFSVGDRAEVDRLHEVWHEQGLEMLQPPVKMAFGYTFTAADPDGHRLRVFTLET